MVDSRTAHKSFPKKYNQFMMVSRGTGGLSGCMLRGQHSPLQHHTQVGLVLRRNLQGGALRLAVLVLLLHPEGSVLQPLQPATLAPCRGPGNGNGSGAVS